MSFRPGFMKSYLDNNVVSAIAKDDDRTQSVALDRSGRTRAGEVELATPNSPQWSSFPTPQQDPDRSLGRIDRHERHHYWEHMPQLPDDGPDTGRSHAWLFSFTGRLLKSEGDTAPMYMQ
jgi:hypothetical protein